MNPAISVTVIGRQLGEQRWDVRLKPGDRLAITDEQGAAPKGGRRRAVLMRLARTWLRACGGSTTAHLDGRGPVHVTLDRRYCPPRIRMSQREIARLSSPERRRLLHQLAVQAVRAQLEPISDEGVDRRATCYVAVMLDGSRWGDAAPTAVDAIASGRAELAALSEPDDDPPLHDRAHLVALCVHGPREALQAFLAAS